MIRNSYIPLLILGLTLLSVLAVYFATTVGFLNTYSLYGASRATTEVVNSRWVARLVSYLWMILKMIVIAVLGFIFTLVSTATTAAGLSIQPPFNAQTGQQVQNS